MLSEFVDAKLLAQGVSGENVDAEFVRFMMNFVNSVTHETGFQEDMFVACAKGDVMIVVQDKWYAQLVD